MTGAAAGIGAALTRAFAGSLRDARVSLIDIDQDGLTEVCASVNGATAYVGDLSMPEQLEDLVASVVSAGGPIDVLINNAGVMDVRTVCATPWQVGERLLTVDLISPLRLINLVVPGMVDRGRGCVVNVSSMAGVTPLRGCTYYGAAKAGLAMASENLRLELTPHGVNVITVYPGPVKSGLERRARGQYRDTLLARVMPTGSPEALAERVLSAYHRRSARVVYPPLYSVASRARGVAGWFTSRFGPAPVD